MDNNIISSYTTDQAVDDGYLVKILPHRWEELTHGKPIMATSNIVNKISLAGIMEIWNEYATKAKTQEQKELFVTKMNNKKVWVIDDGAVYTILYPEDY